MRLVEATLVKKETEDGLASVLPHISLGNKYLIDLDSIKEGQLFNTEKNVFHFKRIVDTYCFEHKEPTGFMFVDLIKYKEPLIKRRNKHGKRTTKRR